MTRLYLCQGPRCSARGAARTRAALEQALWRAGLLATVDLIGSGCQDHCDHGPNLLIQPAGLRLVGVDPARAAALVARHLLAGEELAEWQATPEMRRR